MSSTDLSGSCRPRPVPRTAAQSHGVLALGTAAVGLGSLALLLAASALVGVAPGQGATPTGAPSGPPQVLPLTARLCLVRGANPTTSKPVCIDLEEPRTPQQHAWGLMMRPPLPPRRGMWFAFQPAEPARFWMHRTPNPLDLLYIRANRVVKIDRALPACLRLPCPVYGTQEPVDGVLEIGAGQAEALGIAVGAAVRIEPLRAAGR
ncbi:MAG: DUF192 domain-containing protein [Synechococcaceae cyanobacterium]